MSKYRQNEVDLIKALEAKTPVSEQVKQLAEAREAEKKAFFSALDITDDDFNSRHTSQYSFNEVKQIFWDEYQEQLKGHVR